MYRSLVNIIKVFLYFLLKIKRNMQNRFSHSKEKRDEKFTNIDKLSEIKVEKTNTKLHYRSIICLCLLILVVILFFVQCASCQHRERISDNHRQDSISEFRSGNSTYEFKDSRSEDRISHINRSIEDIEEERREINQTIKTQVSRVRESIGDAEASSIRAKGIFEQIRESVENF